MIKIIGEHGSGKTKKLLEEAFNNNGIVVCKDPAKMTVKADTYGFPGLTFLSYKFFLDNGNDLNLSQKVYMIDDVDEFLKAINFDIVGYSISND